MHTLRLLNHEKHEEHEVLYFLTLCSVWAKEMRLTSIKRFGRGNMPRPAAAEPNEFDPTTTCSSW